MDHSRPTQQVDLGQCLLRATNSRLQLQFTASAHFSQPAHQSRAPPVTVTHLSSIWVTEAPELDIRLSLRAAESLEHAVSVLVAGWGDKLCTSPIWSDLGFIARLKDSHITDDLNTRSTHRLTIGLCREYRASTMNKGRTLPALLQKPPDAHPPLDVPAITLASIDIHLEYDYPPQLEEKFCDLMACGLDSIMDFDQWNNQSKIETFAVAALTVSAHEPTRLDASSPNQERDSIGETISTSQTLLQLLDSGLQRLIISASSRKPQTRTVGKNTLQNLSRLFPAIFNPGYREAMIQRAASIPILSRALTSMLENSTNPILQYKLSLLQTANNPSNLTQNNDSTSSQNTPNAAMHSALWRIAQDRSRRPIAIKRGTSFFAPDSNSREQTPNEEAEASDLLTEDEFEDIDLLDIDQYDVADHDTGTEHASQLITAPLHDVDMELMCEDSPASTQTTMDNDLLIYESTQTTLDDLASPCTPIPFDYSDTEMLF